LVERLLEPPKDSFFLFGPRGTGKTTLLRSWFPRALWFDLLSQQELYNLLRSPRDFAGAVEAHPARTAGTSDQALAKPLANS